MDDALKVWMYDENLKDAPFQGLAPPQVSQTRLVELVRRLQEESYDEIWVTPRGAIARQKQQTAPIALGWDDEEFGACLAALNRPWQPSPQILVQAVANASIVLQRVDRIPKTFEDWTDAQVISDLAMRTLAAALRLGQNILWTGPQHTCQALMTTLAAQGQRPVVVAPGAYAARPDGFTALGSVSEAQVFSADATVIEPRMPSADLHVYLTQLSRTQAWIEAERLDRALMRFEWHTQRSTGLTQSEQAALAVLAGIDLVVEVRLQQEIRVTQVCELVLAESGYQPLPLFQTGNPIAPQALIPVSVPSFVEQLKFYGLDILADDLRYGVGTIKQGPAAEDTPAPRKTPGASAIDSGEVKAPRRVGGAAPRFSHAPQHQVDLDSQPGWELDRLLEGDAKDLQIEPTRAQSIPEAPKAPAEIAAASQAAALAAQFGLGPPPAPDQAPLQRQKETTQIASPLPDEEGTTYADTPVGRHHDKK